MQKKVVPYSRLADVQGADLPTSLRERNLLNVYAALHDYHHCPNGVIDKSQSIGRTNARLDGVMGTLTTHSSMFSLADADCLSTSELAKLMGHNIEKLKLVKISESKMRHMLGMSLHLATAGALMVGLLASAGNQ